MGQIIIRVILHIFHCTCAKQLYFHFWSKICYHHSVHLPRFPVVCGNFDDLHTFTADIGLLLIFACILRTSSLKMFFLGEQNGKGGAMFTPNKPVFTFGGFYVCAHFGENPSRNASVRVHADRHTDRGKLVL